MAAAAAVILGIAALGLGVQLYLGQVLHRQLDNTLKVRAADVDAIAETHPHTFRAHIGADPETVGTDVEVLSTGGSVTVSAHPELTPAGLAVARRVNGTRLPEFTTMASGGKTYRVYVHPLDPGGVVAVLASTDPTDDALGRARVVTVIAALVAAVIAVIACVMLTDRALRPLRQLNSEMGDIRSTADPSKRVTAPPTGDEIEQLATALNAMLEALQRAREVERSFLADASHEMRTPLTALRGNAAYLARHGGDADAFRDLESDMDRLARLLDQLLAVAREDSAPAPTRLVPVSEILDRVSADPRVHVSAEEGLVVHADADALERALANLIDNARRYGPPDTPIEVRAARDGDQAVLSVTDAGRGLDGVSTDQATTRFWRGQNSTGTEGAGLGLGLVRATAERHGGTFETDGGCFALRLPAVEPAVTAR